MSGPTLALGVSAPGVSEVERLAEALASVDNALARLSGTGPNAVNLSGLAAVTSEMAKIRFSLAEQSAGLRTDLAELKNSLGKAFQEGFAAIAAKANAGGKQVSEEVKQAAAETEKAVSIYRVAGRQMAAAMKEAGSYTQYSPIARGSAVKAQFNEERVAMERAVADYRAAQSQRLADQLSFESKQKAMFLEYAAEQRQRFATEATMMDSAVAKYESAQAGKIANQIAYEEKQKGIWIAHNAELQTRLSAEARMMDVAVAQYRKFNAERLTGIQSSVARATASSSSPWTSLISGTTYNLPGKPIEDLGNQAEKTTPKLKALNVQMNEGHSAARGLASGFGAMFLTWGSLLPLLAGAAISHSFVETVKAGAQVQNTFKQIEVLAGASTQEVAALNTQMFEMAKSGQYGPRELAEAMKTLSLAGLDANKVFTTVRDVMNFAVAGDTTIQNAADVMTTVATAFGVSARGYAYVGDTIAVAAAESKSSVQSMGEAFKTASVINQSYGVSLEDTAIGLSLLANAGIQGTAAGTALRNMYADLAGRTPKVTKALQELGVQALDPLTGKMRSQALVLRELMEALSGKTPITQFKYLQDIFSERGQKEAEAIMTAMRTQADETGKAVGTVYDELAKKISDAAGFTTIAAAQMALTPLNQMKSVAATLENTFVETFATLQPMVLDFATQLKGIFNSDEFKSTLQTLMSMFAQLTILAVDHAKAILTVLAAYTALRSAAAVLVGIAAAIKGVAEATGALAVAGAIAAPLMGTIVAIAATGAAAWGLYHLWATKSADATKELGTNNAQELLKRLEEEEDRLNKVNLARSLGISLLELEAKAKLEETRGNQSKQQADALNALADFDRIAKERAALPAYSFGNGGDAGKATQAAARLKLVQDVANADAKHGEVLLGIEATVNRIKTAREETAQGERDAMKQRQDAIANGLGTKPQAAKVYRDTTQSVLAAEMNTRLSLLEDTYQKESKLLDDAYSSQEVSAGVYFAKMASLTTAAKAQELAEWKDSSDKFYAEYSQRWDKISAGKKGGERDQALINLNNQYDKFYEAADAKLKKFSNTTEEEWSKVTSIYTRETNKLVESDKQYWARADQTMQKDLAQSQAKRDLANASEEVRAVAEAQAKVEASHAVVLDNLTTELNKAKKAVDDFYAIYDNRDIGTDTAGAAPLQKRVDALTARIASDQTEIIRLKKLAGEDAINDLNNKKADAARKDIEAMAKDINSKLADAILDGGKDGFSSLRSWATDLFKKPLKLLIQAVISPIGNFVANSVSSVLGLGSGGGSGVGSLLGSGSSLFGGSGLAQSAGNYALNGLSAVGLGNVGAGFAGIGGSYASTVGAGLATDALGATVGLGTGTSIGASAATLGGASSIGAGLAAIPGWGWAALAAGAILGLGGGGDTRYGGAYSSDANGITKFGGPRKGNDGEIQGDLVRSIITSTSSSINSGIAALGGTTTLTNLTSALESSKKGRGFVYAQATLSNGSLVGDQGDLAQNRRGSYTDEQAMAAYQEEMKQVTLQALQGSDIKGKLAEYIRGLGDINSLLGANLEAAYNRVQAALTERATLQSRLDDLTVTSTEKLAKTRAAELATIDDTNTELLKLVYAQEDVNNAAAALLTAYNDEVQANQAQIDALNGYAKALRDWISDSLVGEDSPLGVFEKLAQAADQFNATLVLARGGDADARNALTGKASNYITQLKATSATAVDYAAGYAQVASALNSEADLATSQAALMQSSLDTEKAQLVALGLINDNVASFASAWAAYNNAKDALAVAKAANDTANSLYTPLTSTPASVAATEATADATPWYDHETGGAFATGGYHWGGLRVVGERGPELEATGASYIHDAATTRRILSGGDAGASDAQLSEELRMLRIEMRANVEHTYQMSKDIREFKLRGIPVTNTPDGQRLYVLNTAG